MGNNRSSGRGLVDFNRDAKVRIMAKKKALWSGYSWTRKEKVKAASQVRRERREGTIPAWTAIYGITAYFESLLKKGRSASYRPSKNKIGMKKGRK